MAWHNLITAAMLGIIIGAGSVYKWVDDDGNVHYGERPPEEEQKDAEQVRIQKGPDTDEAADESDTRGDDGGDDGNEDSGPNDAIQKKQCELSREILQRYQDAKFLTKEGEDGEKRRLTEEEKQAEIQRVKNDVEKYCNSDGD